MHYVAARVGVVIDEKWLIVKLIQIHTNKAREMLDILIGEGCWKIGNKYAVVVGETWNGKGYRCAYSYDGARFGLFEIEPKEN